MVRLMIYVCISLAMLVADLRFRYLELLRQGLSVVTYPLQIAAVAPADLVRNASVYFGTLVEVQQDNRELREQLLQAARRLLLFEQLERENERLRGLLEMGQRMPTHTVSAEILYKAPDPFTRKVLLNKGAQQDVKAGEAVVDDKGLVGQVTRVYPIQSEVTLLTDKDYAVPVTVIRSGTRGVLFGVGGSLELRYLDSNADVKVGDRLLTSGLDGEFVPGVPVATVISVNRDTPGFAQIEAEPIAGVERSGQVLVLGRAMGPIRPPTADMAVDPAPSNSEKR